MSPTGWIAFDLDGTLAEWGEGTSNPGDVLSVGAGIPAMVERLQAYVAQGYDVRIFTARVGPATEMECAAVSGGCCLTLPQWVEAQTSLINEWQRQTLGYILPITATKDFHMLMLYDDRCVQVVPNTGETLEARVAELEDGLNRIAAIAQLDPLGQA